MVGKNNLNIYTFITRNSKVYAELLYKSMEKLKSDGNNILYWCVKTYDTFEKSYPLPDGWECIGESGNCGHNSLNHAMAIHKALEHVKKNRCRYVIFCDPDICILYKDWDKVIRKQLEKVQFFGTAFQEGSKFYQKFPNVFFFCFRRHVLNMANLDFKPRIIKGLDSPVRKVIKGKRDVKAYNMPGGSILKCDTGYKLPEIAYNYSLYSNYMPMVLGKDNNSQLPFNVSITQYELCMKKPTHMAEFHYNGKLFCSHKQASRNHPLNKEYGKAWKDRIDLYTQKEFGWQL